MYIYDEIFEEQFYSSKSFDFYYKDSNIIGEQNASIGVFDIETTGLDPRNGQVIMGAILTKVTGGLRVRQFFTEDEGEEEELLILYKEALDEVDVLVSYNGNGFDFPYLRYRLKRYYLDTSFARVLSLDMFRVLNKHSNLREIIPNLKQKTVEEFMGLRDSRDDAIDGGESVVLFFRYLIDKSEELRDIMLLHNRDDVLQLSRILWIFDSLDIHKIASHTGFPVIMGDKRIFVTGIKIKTKRLNIVGRYKGISGRYYIFREDCTVTMEPEYEKTLLEPESDYGKLEISVPLRYEQKITYALFEDIELPKEFFIEKDIYDKEYIIFKQEGVPEYKNINLFIKYLVRDILENI